ncbi:NAD(P)/FAD-dependent oxidoreductase [Bacillus sp. FJAT-26390]|uniref:NAD(P)/FAD-dependent oxidoreductase n=1 Tax=Bacillus sp. FJAT-26390 TaxID=1743142 RepID=UPI000807E046|nr:NAD(P)/FAD-dependent oxidoreductase [Bacillus sp. FJAT-26390]OBZ17294.1 pyridine nucleotide-disulfide oxidoreductase [Bacillus sp. FJAT-26390]
MQYDCIIVGGGFAGLQAAIQLGRYRHNVAVIDAAEGRSTMCRSYHNLIGFPIGIGGAELLALGRQQAEQLGIHFIKAVVVRAEKAEDGLLLHTADEVSFRCKRLLIATGVKDRIPSFPELIPCLGISAYICPDCDGYEVADQQTLVLGAGNAGARMALTLTHWTSDLIYINHERSPVDRELLDLLADKGIPYIEQAIQSVNAEQAQFNGIVLEDGSTLACERCFVAFGGNEVRSGFAKQLGVELMDNKHIIVDPRTKLTSVRNVWAAGDVAAHSEMVTIAMGDGSQAAIWIHKSLIATSM